MTWKVVVDIRAEKDIKKLIKKNLLNKDDFIVIKQWINLVEKYGPEKLSDSSFWNDHELIRDQKWLNCRSSSFSFSGRIIYRIIDKKIIVEVLRITTDHDYR